MLNVKTLIKNLGSVIPNDNKPTPVAMVISAMRSGRIKPKRLLSNVAIKHPKSEQNDAQTSVLPTRSAFVFALSAANSI